MRRTTSVQNWNPYIMPGESTRQYEEVESAVNSALEALGETANQTASEVISVADAQNYWTDALGNYDESAMLATNSLKDLVDAGYMTEDVLTDMAGCP